MPPAPEAVVRPKIEEYIRLGQSYKEMVESLRKHYDTTQYSMGYESLKKKCREWGIRRARGMQHTSASIGPAIELVRIRFPQAGMRDMKGLLRHEHGIEVSEKKVLEYLKTAHPDEVEARLRIRGGMVRKRFWAVGVNDLWTFDQHDKWKRFYLYLHVAIEPVSGFVLWLKVWWTNRNPRLIVRYYCDTVEEHRACPLITQSDRGSENNGIANAHTVLRHRYDPSLSGTLQHKWMHRKGANIKPEIFWSELRKRWTPQFEKLLDYGVHEGLLDPEDYVERMLFFYLFIPYLQQELDVFRDRYNTSKKRRDRNKILPHGPPTLIFHNASAYGWNDFKVNIQPNHVSEVRQLYSAPADDPLFQLVPPAFQATVDQLYEALGSPPVAFESIWTIYVELLVSIRALANEDIQVNAPEHEMSVAFAGEDIEVLALAPFRAGNGVGKGVDSERGAASEGMGDGEGDDLGEAAVAVGEENVADGYSSEDSVPLFHVPEWTVQSSPVHVAFEA
ncbi:hypothetical protein PYCCODRAFT_1372866 [Trametes coccinea BRFM310]|uniref:Integrase core domain-containing protein n=1 Tax=Trametes coccinea (strain BRFM310) TaxID=1353009 RepID=A0A1Y2IEL7_TRAC3|nr:hypothetical protein PYCCODRAFT_1372866 [Trametes coccinea BRFM310]